MIVILQLFLIAGGLVLVYFMPHICVYVIKRVLQESDSNVKPDNSIIKPEYEPLGKEELTPGEIVALEVYRWQKEQNKANRGED